MGVLLLEVHTTHQPLMAAGSAVGGMFASVTGWTCLLVAQRKLLKALESRPAEQRLSRPALPVTGQVG